MSDDAAAIHASLEFLGVPPSKHAAIIAILDQIKAWEHEHPGEDAFRSGQCDDLFGAVGRIVSRRG